VVDADGDGQDTLGFKIRTSGHDDPRREIFGAAVAHEWVLLDLHREHVSLEDTFRRLTQGKGGH
jgi:ABC-2 type transport system ATP-binding protein